MSRIWYCCHFCFNRKSHHRPAMNCTAWLLASGQILQLLSSMTVPCCIQVIFIDSQQAQVLSVANGLADVAFVRADQLSKLADSSDFKILSPVRLLLSELHSLAAVHVILSSCLPACLPACLSACLSVCVSACPLRRFYTCLTICLTQVCFACWNHSPPFVVCLQIRMCLSGLGPSLTKNGCKLDFTQHLSSNSATA